EFRALCLFAVQDYQSAAAAIHAVLTTGPGWDWTTVSGLYADTSVYTGQLAALEDHCDRNPQAAAPRFLLAYHYMLGGHNDQACAMLQIVTELEPNDQLSGQLLKGLQNPDQPPPEPKPTLAKAEAKPVEPTEVVGNWKASRTDGSSFELNLTK